jgi:hypothetical protein
MGQIRKHLPDFAEAGSDVVDFVSNRVLVGMESANFTE